MAYESVPGVKIVAHGTDLSYIFGDFFAVYNGNEPVPRIYTWQEIIKIEETRTEMIITAKDAVYQISKAAVPDIKKFLSLRAILEGAAAANPSIEYVHLRRILPPKTYYKNCDVPDNAYIVSGTYNEKEISYSNVVLLNTRLGKIFRLIGILTFLAVALICFFVIGDIERNWIYFLTITGFSAVGASMFVYLACSVIAKYIYTALFKVDPSITQPITFVVCSEGFAAVENCVYTGSDIIRWEEAAYFIETNYVFIIFKNRKAVFWLPKRLFKKDQQSELSNFIAHKLQQK